MRFGNSNGNNRGKKYLNRKNLDFNTLTASDYLRLDDFNTWYTDNIESMEQALKTRGVFNEDVANDTYAEICETLLFAATIIGDYAAYFSQAYFTNRTRAMMNAEKYVLVDSDNSFNQLFEESETLDDSKMNKDLISDMMEYVKRNYSLSEHFLFYQYVNLEKRSYLALALKADKTVYEVQKIIRKIKLDIQANEDLATRRKQIQ